MKLLENNISNSEYSIDNDFSLLAVEMMQYSNKSLSELALDCFVMQHKIDLLTKELNELKQELKNG